VDSEGEVVAEADVAPLGILLWDLVGSWGEGSEKYVSDLENMGEEWRGVAELVFGDAH